MLRRILLGVLLWGCTAITGVGAEPCADGSGSATTRDGAPGLELLRMGGSNYISYGDIAAYHATMKLSPSDRQYRFDTSLLRPVIATYHLSPGTVKTQLQQIRESGQAMISLIMWFANYAPRNPNEGYRGILLSSRGGALQPQQQQNLIDIIGLIRQLKFTRLILRVGPLGGSSPYQWKGMREEIFRDDMKFMESIVATAKKALAGSGVELLFDLGAEQAGTPQGVNETYVKRVWSRICSIYSDCEKSFYFSFNPVPSRSQPRIALYHSWLMQANGRLPRYWAYDVYGFGGGQGWAVSDWDVYSQLVDVFTEMQKVGQARKPVILQEVFYDDPRTAADIKRFARKYPMRLDAIIQWPNSRAAYQKYFKLRTRNFASVDFPVSYCAYAPLVSPVSVVSAGRTLIRVDHAACLKRGQPCHVQLRWNGAAAIVVARGGRGAAGGEIIGCGRTGDVGLDRPPTRNNQVISVYETPACTVPPGARSRPAQRVVVRWN